MGQLFPVIVSLATLISFGTADVTKAGSTDISGVQFAQRFNCNNPQTQTEMNACAGLAYQQAEKKLNQVYQQLLPQLSSSRRQKLISAQQAWIKFRDSSCAFERSEVEGGTMAPLIYSSCLADVTEQRTQRLQEYIDTAR